MFLQFYLTTQIIKFLTEIDTRDDIMCCENNDVAYERGLLKNAENA